jgi:phospholipase C
VGEGGASGRFLPDLENGDLPEVSWLVPPLELSDHPARGRSICPGENWTVEVLNALQSSPEWENTIVFLTCTTSVFLRPRNLRPTSTSTGWACAFH